MLRIPLNVDTLNPSLGSKPHIKKKKTYILKFTWWKIRKIKTYVGFLSLMAKSTEETFKPKKNLTGGNFSMSYEKKRKRSHFELRQKWISTEHDAYTLKS